MIFFRVVSFFGFGFVLILMGLKCLKCFLLYFNGGVRGYFVVGIFFNLGFRIYMISYIGVVFCVDEGSGYVFGVIEGCIVEVVLFFLEGNRY